ncbi:MAG: CBS domain-containing protein [Candidatus Micrarchaeota archaeon]
MKLKTDVRVGDCMTRGVVTLKTSESAYEAAKALKRNRIGCVIVTENKKVAGIVTERDLVYKVLSAGKDAKKVKLKGVMSTPVKVVLVNTTISEAAQILKQKGVKRLPVVDAKKRVVGIVTEGDLLSAYPGLLEVLSEKEQIERFGSNSYVRTGSCEKCGTYSETLKCSSKGAVCEECLEEEEI